MYLMQNFSLLTVTLPGIPVVIRRYRTRIVTNARIQINKIAQYLKASSEFVRLISTRPSLSVTCHQSFSLIQLNFTDMTSSIVPPEAGEVPIFLRSKYTK